MRLYREIPTPEPSRMRFIAHNPTGELVKALTPVVKKCLKKNK